jgi:glycosyltransferase involved in cell wall biosynthesis
MRIVHAIHNFPPEFVGGTEAYLAALVKTQLARGDEPVVIAGSEIPGVERLEESYEGIRVLRLRHDPSRGERFGIRHEFPRLATAIDSILAELRPDVMHVHHWFNLASPIVRLSKAKGIRTVVSLHDYFALCPRFFLVRPDGEYCGDLAPIPRARCGDCVRPDVGLDDAALDAELAARAEFFRAELAAADVCLAPSRVAASLFASTAILGAVPRIEILPLGLLRPFAREELVRREPDGEGRLRLVFFGNVAPVKGLDDLIAAIDRLTPAARAKIVLRVLGRGTDEALEERLRAAGTRFALEREAGYDRARLLRLPAEADLAVFPSRAAETYSLVVDEALALGLPLLVTDRGAMAERAGGAALVVKPGAVGEIASCLEKLAKHRDLLVDLHRAAKKQVFTIGDHAARLAALYGAK